MRGQNPVFIPGPTNIPDKLRFAMAVQTMDHRAADFADLLGPLLNDLKRVFKTGSGQVITLSFYRNRRLGSGNNQYVVTGRQGAGGALRHVLAPLDRPVSAP